MNFCDVLTDFYEDEDRNVFSNGISINALDCNSSIKQFDKFCQVPNMTSDANQSCELLLNDMMNRREPFIYYDIEGKEVTQWNLLTTITPQFYNNVNFNDNVRLSVYLKKNILVVCGIADDLNDSEHEFIKYIDISRSPNTVTDISTDITFDRELPMVDVSSNGLVAYISFSSSFNGLVQMATLTIFDTNTNTIPTWQILQYSNVKCMKITSDGQYVFYLVYDTNASTYRFLKVDLSDGTTTQLLPNSTLTSVAGQDVSKRHSDVTVSNDGSFAYLALLLPDYIANGISVAGPMHIYKIRDINTSNPIIDHCDSEGLSPNNILSFSNMFGNNTLLIAYTPDIQTQYQRHIIRCYDSSGQLNWNNNWKSIPTPINDLNGGMISLCVSDVGDKHVIYLINVYDFPNPKYRMFKSTEFNSSDLFFNIVGWTQSFANISINTHPSSDSMFDLQTILKYICSSQENGELVYVKDGNELHIALEISQIINNLNSNNFKIDLYNNGLLELKNSNDDILYSSNTSDGTSSALFHTYETSESILSPNEFYWIHERNNLNYLVLNPIPNSFFGLYSSTNNGNYIAAKNTLDNYCNSVSTYSSSICFCWNDDAILDYLFDIEDLKKHESHYTLLKRIAPCMTSKCNPENFEHGSFTRNYLENLNCVPNLTVCTNIIEAKEGAQFNGNITTDCDQKLKCEGKTCPNGSECDERTGYCRMICSDDSHCPNTIDCDITNGLCLHNHKKINVFVVVILVVLILGIFAVLYIKTK